MPDVFVTRSSFGRSVPILQSWKDGPCRLRGAGRSPTAEALLGEPAVVDAGLGPSAEGGADSRGKSTAKRSSQALGVLCRQTVVRGSCGVER